MVVKDGELVWRYFCTCDCLVDTFDQSQRLHFFVLETMSCRSVVVEREGGKTMSHDGFVLISVCRNMYEIVPIRL